MKIYMVALCGVLAAFPAFAADYDNIDPGDIYLLNRWGRNNSRVLVIRKLDDGMVKVQDIDTGTTSIEAPSKLLSETELRQAETKSKAVGWGAVGLGLWCAAGNCNK